MMYSIESRSPLLDFRLLKFLGAHEKFKFYKGFNKYLLRSLLSKKVPHSISWRKDKQGLRWNPNEFLEKNRETILETVLNSQIISELFCESNREGDIADFFSKDNGLKNDLLQKCYSLSLLEEAYNLSLETVDIEV